jgi:hypothetical protein
MDEPMVAIADAAGSIEGGVGVELDAVRPVITGVIGGLFSLWLIRRWAPYVPMAYKAKTADELAAENRVGVMVGNSLFIGAMLVGVWLFKSGQVPSNSWSHFCLVFGVAVLAPFAAVLLPTIGKGRDRAVEAVVALAIAQRVPLLGVVLIGIVGIVCLTIALGSLVGGSG